MVCIIHKWDDGCKCLKCGKIREVKYNYMHDWRGCTCIKCGKIRNDAHDFKCGVCTICGAEDAKKGHGEKGYQISGRQVEVYCTDCGKIIQTFDWDALYDRTLEEIENADKAGCVSPKAEALLAWLIANHPQ